MKVEIRPQLSMRDSIGTSVQLVDLIALLKSIAVHASITKAAHACGLSYRNAWGMLTAFSTQFGTDLVVKVRGRGTVLSPLAEKLIWADKRVIARLTPAFESLASELQRELDSVLPDPEAVSLRLTASHGFGIAALVTQLETQGHSVEISYRGSTDSLAALSRGECDIAGFHLPVGEFRAQVGAHYSPLLDPDRDLLVHLAYRTQGLLVARGNPLEISALTDLANSGIRFVNRQIGSGTRLLLDLLLNKSKIAPASINGYDTVELTHAAVAAYVASGMADAGLGVEAAARRFNLDFIPLEEEQYLLALHIRNQDSPKIRGVLSLLESKIFKAMVAFLPGYDASLSGQRIPMASLKQANEVGIRFDPLP